MMETHNPVPGDLVRALTFPFTDKRWPQKLLVGILMGLAGCLIPLIPTVFLLGYYFRISRRIISEDGQAALPDWDDWSKLLTDGFKYLGVSVIYSMPMTLSVLVLYGVMFLPMLPMLSTLTTIDQSNSTGMFPGIMGSYALIFLMYPMLSLNMLISLLTFIFLPPALMHMVARDSFGAAFQFSHWWKIFKVNFGGFIIAFLISLALLSVLYFGSYILMMSIVLCIISPIFIWVGTVLIGLITSGLYAQAYRVGVEKLAMLNSPTKPVKSSTVIVKKATRSRVKKGVGSRKK